jgi:potassium-transporting ATPase ATP-binding subunit
MMQKTKGRFERPNILNRKIVFKAIVASFSKLSPRCQLRNPVMFVTYISAIISTLLCLNLVPTSYTENPSFMIQISIWLWGTILFANFSESLAEGRGKAQAAFLKMGRHEVTAKKLIDVSEKKYIIIPGAELKKNDLVLVEAGDTIPGDGQVIAGVAAIDESAITGESAPVIRERGGDRDAVTGGTVVLSDWIAVKITSNPGGTFLDRMICLVECAKRQRTPNEIALSILLAGITLIFLWVVMALLPFSIFSIENQSKGDAVSVAILLALLVCLIPTTIGGLLSAIGIAGMDRLIRANVIANSGRAVEAAGDVSILLLDKTGTITLGNRQAVAFYPAKGVSIEELSQAAELSSIADETPEGKSIVQLSREKYQVKPTDIKTLQVTFIPFSAETRMSGIQLPDRKILKGAAEKITSYVQQQQGIVDQEEFKRIEIVARQGATPLLVTDGKRVLGVIELKDIIKPGIKNRLAELRLMGIKSIMITGDNPYTAAAIGNETGVDDYYAEVTPEKKLKIICDYQAKGYLVAMVGDGTNDAPALAQTDVAVAMNSGTQAAKEAANMVDLDSDPTKLIEIVKIGKQLLMTRGALTTFSIANDVSKYFAIVPAAFASTFPVLNKLNVMQLGSPNSAILSAVIFNALIIVFLIPLALKGINYRPMSASEQLRHNIFIYGLGGLIIPFIGIKVIDLILNKIGAI